jgi:DNA ligase-4
MTDFSLFCDLVQACHSLSLAKPAGRPRTGKETLRTATAFFTEWTATALPRPFAPGTGAIVFRLLFPDLDVRRRYNLKETILARNLVKLFGLSTRPGSRGHALLSWKSDGDDQEDFPRPGCLGLEVQGILAPAVCRVLVLVDGIPDLQQSQIKRSTMTLESIDELLDELATHSPYSQLGHTIPSTRSARDILRALYADVAPFEAAVLTQIILKDLHPMLYPLPALSTSTALLQYDSASLEELDLRTAMRIWHWAMLPVYNVRADLDRAATIVEAIPKGVRACARAYASPDSFRGRTTGRYPALPRHPPKRVDARTRRPRRGGSPYLSTDRRLHRAPQVPKAVKGQSCDMAIRNFARGSTVYVETKYDGERCVRGDCTA